MILPDKQEELQKFAPDIVQACRVSQGQRGAAYRQYAQWIETGRATGGLALANLLYSHIDRLQSHLFSPPELQFAIDFENHYPKTTLAKGEMAARLVTREWDRKNIDVLFGQGIKEGLSYGGCLLKQIGSAKASGATSLTARLVMPWNFGVYNEGVNSLHEQEAMVETVYLTKYEVWRRIRHLPNPEALYKRILSHSTTNEGVGLPTSFMHQVLSTSVLNTGSSPQSGNTPGGIVQLSNDPSFATLGPMTQADLIQFHEITVKDDDRDDWTTIQMVEPDIVIAPRFKRVNLFCPDTLPYQLIQPNVVTGYFWGRSEIVDLMELQNLLTTNLDDIRRLMGLQFDRLLAFIGDDGISDETYGQFRNSGYMTLSPNAKVEDLTPELPPHAFEFIMLIKKFFEEIGGFSNILSGQGEAGVRAGNHAETLLRTASPRLRDRALLVERQCASAADATLAWMESKDAQTYWTDPDTGKDAEFLLSQLPEDRRVIVDSHSSSPVFEENHLNKVAFGVKSGFLDGESAIEMLKFPNPDLLKQRYREAQHQKQELIREHPELLTKGNHKR